MSELYLLRDKESKDVVDWTKKQWKVESWKSLPDYPDYEVVGFKTEAVRLMRKLLCDLRDVDDGIKTNIEQLIKSLEDSIDE